MPSHHAGTYHALLRSSSTRMDLAVVSGNTTATKSGAHAPHSSEALSMVTPRLLTFFLCFCHFDKEMGRLSPSSSFTAQLAPFCVTYTYNVHGMR